MHELQKNRILVAKPYNDQNGTDLLAFINMHDGVKFCRIQCKGRTVLASNKNNTDIPKSYVTNGFIVFLYLDFGDNTDELYMFLASDIRLWNLSPNNEYTLSLSHSNVREKLKRFRFESSKIVLIKHLIEQAETNGEFNQLIYAQVTETRSPMIDSSSVNVQSNA